MTRLRLLAVAVLCLGASAAAAPPPMRAEVSLTTAVGRSMGGLRVLVVDILFIRAQALVNAGRAEDLAEAQQLYETILLLDPTNDAAHVFLVDMHVHQMLPLGTTREARFGWWKEAWDLAQRGLALNPASALMHWRIAELLADIGINQAAFLRELLPDVEELVPDRRARLLGHLVRAIRLRENLPTRGFAHLSRLAMEAPVIAAEAALEGDEALFQRALAAGIELLRLRRDRLRQIDYEGPPGPDGRPTLIDRAALLEAGLNAVGKIRTAREAGRPEAAQRVVEAYAAFAGQSRMLAALERLARGQ